MIFLTGAQPIQSPSAPELQALRMKIREETRTGILEVEYPNGEVLAFLVYGGMLMCAYRLDVNMAQKRDADQEWNALDHSLPERLSFLPLTVHGLRLVRIAIEHPVPAETLRVASGRLDHIFDQWHKQIHPCLAVLKWPQAQGFVILCPGMAVPPAALLVSTSGQAPDAEALKKILSPDVGECDVARHSFVSDGSSWEEYSFQCMFDRLLEAILLRYKELTGLALLNALDRNINRVAFENKWDFSITLGVVTDRMYLRDLDELLGVCKSLLEIACEHIGVVLGRRLAQSLLQDAMLSLDAHSIRVIEKYSIAAFLNSPRSILISGERTND